MLTKIPKTIQSSELRKNLARYLKDSDKSPVFVSKERGSGSSVLIGADIYNKMIEAYEDAIDARDFLELKKNDDGERIPWSAVKDM